MLLLTIWWANCFRRKHDSLTNWLANPPSLPWLLHLQHQSLLPTSPVGNLAGHTIPTILVAPILAGIPGATLEATLVQQTVVSSAVAAPSANYVGVQVTRLLIVGSVIIRLIFPRASPTHAIHQSRLIMLLRLRLQVPSILLGISTPVPLIMLLQIFRS